MDSPGPAKPPENRTLGILRTRRGPARVLPSNLRRYRREPTTASGAVCVGSNPTGGAFNYQVIWPLNWPYAESHPSQVCSRVPPYAARHHDSRNISGTAHQTLPACDHEQAAAAITVSDQTLEALHSGAIHRCSTTDGL